MVVLDEVDTRNIPDCVMARIYLSLGFLSYLAMLASHFDWFWGLSSAYPESSPNHAVLSFYSLNIVMLF